MTLVESGPSLLPIEKAKPEKLIYKRYTNQILKVVFIQGPIIAWTIYLVTTKILFSDTAKDLIDSKIQFLHQNDLHYVYISVYMIYLARLALVVNANGARAPTRLGRPDQHIYQVVGEDNKKQALVMMASDGVNGRFNRAQRGVMNMDEGLPIFLMNTLLVSVILGQVATFFLVPLYVYGRVKFAHDYKVSAEIRLSGFLFSMIAEHGMASMIALIAIKAALGDLIQF
eukprot:CAMPEP_0178971052 /NCGR_PEP_ID=MMETSP0789-20121207/20001_1 /TAXON_ID=3005 /ORGANISM="Rhizosolenia setigera, Strain CCMP 1694" /LENGTH=227 /DNA_ID=CAMNT_0020657861 /DNA_START=57 /DNA_END=740 /DNA_ORIENTATION=-